MNNITDTEHWSENIIIVDGDYVDSVAFNLIVNFERMIGRRIHNADTANWIDCIALDGGLRKGDHDTQVIFLHNKENDRMKYFTPGEYEKDLNGKAFKDNLGEFSLSAYKVESLVSKDDFLLDILKTAANHKDVKRIMIIANTDDINMVEIIRNTLRDVNEDKIITLFGMQPLISGNYRQEILGYSLMSALGIRSEEVKAK